MNPYIEGKGNPNYVHGMRKHPLYGRWLQMISRCENKGHSYYEYYGKRGIKVCIRWHSFPNFLKDMGMPKKNMTLDRINNDKSYCKSNCKWATRYEQRINQRPRRKLT